jgi:hypothetical protein
VSASSFLEDKRTNIVTSEISGNPIQVLKEQSVILKFYQLIVITAFACGIG